MYDMKNLSKMKNLETHAPEAMKAFVAFDKAALAEGAIPRKYKELMALAVAFTTQCPYCIELHANKAREMGASDPEIAEAVLVAAALRAGGGDHPRHTCHEGKLTERLECRGKGQIAAIRAIR
jgi:AhpD family alkylhydroperoxidase